MEKGAAAQLPDPLSRWMMEASMSGSARAVAQPRRSGSYHRAEETQSYEDATSDGRGDVQLSLRIAPAEPDESRDMSDPLNHYDLRIVEAEPD